MCLTFFCFENSVAALTAPLQAASALKPNQAT
jgi:hypothetical protein